MHIWTGARTSAQKRFNNQRFQTRIERDDDDEFVCDVGDGGSGDAGHH